MCIRDSIIRSVVRKRRKRRLFDAQLRMAQKNRLAVLHIKAERVLPKTGRCANVREHCGNGKRRRWMPTVRLWQRKKPQAAKQDKAVGSCAPRGGHICPPCGQFRGFARGFLKQRKTALGRCRMKKVRCFKENSGVPTKFTR